MDKIRVMGKNLDEARSNAAQCLGVDINDVVYEVIENAKTGFLGFNSRPCKIDAWCEKEEEIIKEHPDKTVPEKIEHKEKRERSIAKDKTNAINTAKDFLAETLEKMGIKAELEITKTEESVDIVVKGDNMGMVIGRRGETLDALQYLTSLVVNKDKDEYVRINLDTENYRKKRTLALEKLADKVAEKVVRNKRNLTLEPMNSFERRIIHSRLQGDDRLTTYSIGEEPSRRIVVSLKNN